MKYLIAIPYVNRPDLLKLTINSIQLFWPHAIIIDNSANRDLRKNSRLPPEVSVYEPPVPLSFSQTANYLYFMANNKQCDIAMLMHSDAEAMAKTPEKLLSLLSSLLQNNARKWGVVFTNYDSLAAFNMEAVKTTGEWDTILPQYFADNDYYRRLKLEGYEIINSDLPVTHNISSTIKSDSAKFYLNSMTFPLYKIYYEKKWGGSPGNESYTSPFGIPHRKH